MWSVDILKYLSSEAFGATLIALGLMFVIASVCYWDEINRPQRGKHMYKALRYFGTVVGAVRVDGSLYIKSDSPAVSYWEQRGYIVVGVEHSAPLGIPQCYFLLQKPKTVEAAE